MWSFAGAGLNDTSIHCLTSWSRLGSNWCKLGRTDGRQIRWHYLTQTFHHARNLSMQTRILTVAQKYTFAKIQKYRFKNTQKYMWHYLTPPFPTHAIFQYKQVLHCSRALLLAYLFNELLKNWIPTFARVALIYGFRWPERLSPLIFLLLSFCHLMNFVAFYLLVLSFIKRWNDIHITSIGIKKLLL